MKIAYIITGHLRTIDKCYKSFFKNIYVENSDIYIHTWSTVDMKTRSWHKYKCRMKYNIEDKLKLYKPKDYIIEKQDLNMSKKIKKLSTIVSNVPNYYSFY